MKKKREFSKLLATWAVAIATAVLLASFVLAACDKEPVSDLAIAVFTGCVGYLVTYAGKSAFEKNSRNRYGLDADGVPHEMGSQEEGTRVIGFCTDEEEEP